MATYSHVSTDRTGVNTPTPPAKPNNLTIRTITAVVLMPVGIFGTFVGGWPWLILMLLLAFFATLEFYALAAGRPVQGSARVGVPVSLGVVLAYYLASSPLVTAALVAAALGLAALGGGLVARRQTQDARLIWRKAAVTLAGVVYVGLPLAMLVGLSRLPDHFVWLVIVFAITWGTDTFAYLGGSAFGRHKLAPALSPKKTWEGAVVGWLAGAALSLLFLTAGDKVSGVAVLMALIGPVLAILGDLLESAVKRGFQVKDSHLAGLNLVPGHGGVLDRIDALLLVSVFCYLVITLSGIAG